MLPCVCSRDGWWRAGAANPPRVRSRARDAVRRVLTCQETTRSPARVRGTLFACLVEAESVVAALTPAAQRVNIRCACCGVDTQTGLRAARVRDFARDGTGRMPCSSRLKPSSAFTHMHRAQAARTSSFHPCTVGRVRPLKQNGLSLLWIP